MAVVAALATTAVMVAQPSAPATGNQQLMTSVGGSGGGLERFTGQHLTWHGCQTGPDDDLGKKLDDVDAQCADVTVPLDYTKPDGRTLTVAISRRRATDTAHRLGTLVVNTGGPGESISTGVTWVVNGEPPFVATGSPKVAARYDLVGVDPRFHHRSSPLKCLWPTGAATRAPFVGPDRASFERSVALTKDLAGRCTAQKDLLPHASTRDIARDLDVVRAVLGEQKISYLGWSYGSILGAVYGQLFPSHLDRTVIDGNLDPSTWGPESNRGNSPAQVAEQRNWAAWAARHHRTYRLGSTTAQVMHVLDVIGKVADRGRPVPMGRYQVDLNSVRSLGLGTDTEETYALWSQLMRLFYDAARGRKVALPPEVGELFESLSATEESSEASAFWATLCADRAASSRDPETYYRDIQAHRTDEPFYGPPNRNVTPCTFWPASPAEAPTQVQNAVPVLMVAATGDPAVPYPGQLAMHRALTGSRLITLKGAFRHGVYLFEDNKCVNDRVNHYLLTGDLPAADTTCTRTSPIPK